MKLSNIFSDLIKERYNKKLDKIFGNNVTDKYERIYRNLLYYINFFTNDKPVEYMNAVMPIKEIEKLKDLDSFIVNNNKYYIHKICKYIFSIIEKSLNENNFLIRDIKLYLIKNKDIIFDNSELEIKLKYNKNKNNNKELLGFINTFKNIFNKLVEDTKSKMEKVYNECTHKEYIEEFETIFEIFNNFNEYLSTLSDADTIKMPLWFYMSIVLNIIKEFELENLEYSFNCFILEDEEFVIFNIFMNPENVFCYYTTETENDEYRKIYTDLLSIRSDFNF